MPLHLAWEIALWARIKRPSVNRGVCACIKPDRGVGRTRIHRCVEAGIELNSRVEAPGVAKAAVELDRRVRTSRVRRARIRRARVEAR